MGDALRFTCPSCHFETNVDDRFGGTRGSCPSCHAPVQIPSAAASAVTRPVAPRTASTRSAAATTPSAARVSLASSSMDANLALEIETARSDPTKVFGRFVVLGELGRGGMGVVSRAWDERLRRTVALKTLLVDGDAKDAIDRFYREAEVVARLRHENIVAIHDVGELEGKPYIAMEFVSGTTLSRRLAPTDGSAKLPLTKGLEAVRDVARAVQHAHEQGVIHRDLKPQNIMLDAQGHPYVLDFGLARIRDSKTRLTKSGAMLGTPAYMPPEQAGEASVEANERSDVYSLGATLYQVLTGRPPFEGSEVNVLTALLTKDPAPPRSINPRAPADVETICLRCLEKEPARRYPTAGELADELDRYLAGEPIEASPIGPVSRLLRRARRNRVVTALLLLLVLAVGLGVGLGIQTLALQARTRRERFEEAIQKRAESDRQVMRACLELSERSVADHRYREAAIYAAKAQSIEDSPATRAAAFTARRGPWRAPVVLPGHASPVSAVAFSPDGTKLLSAGQDRVVKVWDLERRTELFTLSHEDTVVSAAWAGSWIASASNDGTCRLWDPTTGRELERWKVSRPVSVAFDAEGKRLLVAGAGALSVRDLETRQELARFPLKGVTLLAADLSPDGQNVVALVFGGVRLFAVNHPEQKPDELDLKDVWLTVRFLSGERLVAGTSVGITTADCISLWDKRSTTSQHASARAVALGQRGRLCASANEDQTVTVYDMRTSSIRTTLTQQSSVRAVAIDGSGRWLATAGSDGKVCLWDLEPGASGTIKLGGAKQHVLGVAFPGEGRVATAGGQLKLWDTGDGHELAALGEEDGGIDCAAFSRDGAAAVTGDLRGVVSLWDVPGGKRRVECRGHGTAVSSVAFSPDGKRIASGSADATARLWSAADGTELASLPHPGAVAAVAFGKDGASLATACADGKVRLWDAASGSPRETLAGHTGDVLSLAFSRDGSRLASGGDDRTIRLWEPGKSADPVVLGAHAGPVVALSFDASGERLASAGHDGAVKLWDVGARKEILSLSSLSETLYGVALSPDGKLMAEIPHAPNGTSSAVIVALEPLFQPSEPGALEKAEAATGLRISPETLQPVPVDAAPR